MVKQIIKEAIEKNPIGLKESVEAELMSRIQVALEAKKSSMEDDGEEDEELEESEDFNELEESADKKLQKAMAIINARITKQGQPPKYTSYDSAPEDIKTAAKNLAKNMKESVELDEKVNTGPEEAISIISNSISMNPSVVKAALEAADLDPVAVVTALKGKKTIKAMQLGNLVMGHAFGGSISKKDLTPIKKATDAAFVGN